MNIQKNSFIFFPKLMVKIYYKIISMKILIINYEFKILST